MLKFKFSVSYGIIKQVQAKAAVMASFSGNMLRLGIFD